MALALPCRKGVLRVKAISTDMGCHLTSKDPAKTKDSL